MKITFRNLYLALKDQLPLGRAYRNFIITGQAWGMFHANSHISLGSGQPKVQYRTRQRAEKAAEDMGKRHGARFSVYKCVFCDGYHIGRSRTRSEAKQRMYTTKTP